MAKKLPDLPVGIDAYLAGAKDTPTVPPSGPKAAEIAPEAAPAKKADEKPKAIEKKPTKKPAPAEKPKMPWDDIDPTLMKPLSTRIRAKLHEKASHYATHKYNLTAIINDALEHWLEKMEKERRAGDR